MGRVYLAKDTRLDRRVALKVLSRDRMTNPRAVARFRREAKVGAQLQHENLVRIYDEGESHGARYLVMEYIEGKTVGKMIAEHGPLPPPMACRIARQVALGLEHAHQKGLIHRDVNPMNILLDRSGTAKLTDLGLAIDLGDLGDAVTRDGATVGTFDYISPEQARHSRNVDIRSDLYSLGCSLYHMLSGRVPYPQPSLPEKLYAHQLIEAESLRAIVPAIPEGLEAIVRRLMAKSPDDRFPTPALAAQALEPYQSAASAMMIRPGSASEPFQLDPASSAINGAPLSALPASAGSDPEFRGPLHIDPLPRPTLPQIDFGPEPPLSESLSSDRSPGGTERKIRLWIGAGAVLAVMLLIAVALAGKVNPGPGPGKTNATNGKVDTKNTTAQSRSNIVVKFLDDSSEAPQASLHEAIRAAVGKPAEIILREEKAIELNLTKPLEVSGGAVVIRAADGAKPKITVLLTGASSFLRVNSSGALRLSGLTIDFEYHGDRGKMLPSLIETAGELGLDRCAFSTGGPERDLAVAIAEGSRTTITGCVFMGFNNPLRLRSFPGFETRVRQCLFVRSKPGDQGAGWPLKVTLGQAPSTNPRHVTIDHCTALGAGLLELDGFTAEQPIRVNVHASVVKARSLLMWSGPGEFPKGLSWKGSANRYSISGASWVVRGPSGFDAVEHGPVNLETWSSATTAEPGSVEDPIQFTAESSTGALLEAQEWKSFVIEPSEPPNVGIDPAFVGPGAKPLRD
jgi:serine/threonine protein kinase